MELNSFATDMAKGIALADSRKPVAIGVRTKRAYRPGIGPHTEARALELAIQELKAIPESGYSEGSVHLQVPYPSAPRSRCDICMGAPAFEWAIEVKMLRMMGDNEKPNDNMLMHILSPYPGHRSALTDAQKLLASGFVARKAILIYAFDYPRWPMALAIDAFETLCRARVALSPRETAPFSGLVHPVHSAGAVLAWEVFPLTG